MSDTYRRYRAIKQGIMQFYQPHPSGHQARHLDTLVALICGLAGGRHAHLSTIADHAPSHGADFGAGKETPQPKPGRQTYKALI